MQLRNDGARRGRGRTALTRTLAAALALGLLPLSSASAQQTSGEKAGVGRWPPVFTNPAAMPDDFVLPAPCGAEIVFRRVETITPKSWIMDQKIYLGRADGEAPFNDSILADGLAGGVPRDDDPAARAYYIGKYEITADQYAAVMEPDCPLPSEAGMLPIHEISWFDAVGFTRAYTEWLNENAADALPKAGPLSAFVRLPTEAEWEFAARGGNAISAGDRRRKMFPMPDGELQDYVWYKRVGGCGGARQPIGEVEPNPLGLFDIVGNVSEYAVDLYRMRRAGRPHGQTGAAVARGGSCLTPEAFLSTSLRDEVSLFDRATGKAGRPSMVGFRVVVAMNTIRSQAHISQLRTDWDQSRKFRTVDGAQDPVALLKTIADRLGRPEDLSANDSAKLREEAAQAAKRVEEVARRVEQEIQERNRVEIDSAVNAIFAGWVGLRGLATDARQEAQIRCSPGIQPRVAKVWAARLASSQEIFEGFLLHAAEEVAPERFEAAKDIAAKRYEKRYASGPKIRRQAFDLFIRLVEQQRATPGGDTSKSVQAVKDFGFGLGKLPPGCKP